MKDKSQKIRINFTKLFFLTLFTNIFYIQVGN